MNMEICDIKRWLNKLVGYKGHRYIFNGVVLRKNEKEFFYQAELKDVKSNSLVICRLEDVKIE